MTPTATWEDVVQAKTGHVFHDSFDEGLRFIILRGPASVCAYVGIPLDHPLAGHDYDSLPVQAHGGLTYSSAGNNQYLPENMWWYGWDYAHCDDFCTFDVKYQAKSDATKWTPDQVIKDSWSTLYDFKKLLKLAENIQAKTKGCLMRGLSYSALGGLISHSISGATPDSATNSIDQTTMPGAPGGLSRG